VNWFNKFNPFLILKAFQGHFEGKNSNNLYPGIWYIKKLLDNGFSLVTAQEKYSTGSGKGWKNNRSATRKGVLSVSHFQNKINVTLTRVKLNQLIRRKSL